MASGIGEQLKGMMRKAKQYWAELTDEDSSQARQAQRQSRAEEQEDAVHQRYGGVRTQGEREFGMNAGERADTEAEAAYRDHLQNSQDRGPSDAVMASPAARAGRGRAGQGGQLGGQDVNRPFQAGSQQMQESRGRQYSQQGGSGIQKTMAEQMKQQGSSDAQRRYNGLDEDDTDTPARPNPGSDTGRRR